MSDVPTDRGECGCPHVDEDEHGGLRGGLHQPKLHDTGVTQDNLHSWNKNKLDTKTTSRTTTSPPCVYMSATEAELAP